VSPRRTAQNPLARWLPVGGAAALLALVVGIGIVSGRSDSEPADGEVGTTNSLSTTTLAPLPTVTYEAVETDVDSEDVVEKVALSQTLSSGNSGSEVEMVQSRLAELGFDPGPVDGAFGGLTTQAVWAFEKLVMGTPRSEATGKVTAALWDRMQDPIRIAPRRPTNTSAGHTEIYLPEQVLVVFHADEAVLVAHISSGELAAGATGFTPWYETADEYCETVTIDTNDRGELLEEPIEKAICGRSYTPPGVFTAYKKIEGRRESRLGGMYDPIYINQGIAIHGANSIPLEPASHGCIRVSRTLGEKLPSLIAIGDEVLIWDGVTEPWNQSAEAMQMRFDYPDPNATTTTTTPSTTTTTSTVPPTTDAPATTEATTPSTEAPTTTAAPASTTTVPATTTTTAKTTTTTSVAEPGEG
jgi:Putative peptidoglycan binding domain/L,D-transpeptidase catalytic domain